jgi:hypothetical protein
LDMAKISPRVIREPDRFKDIPQKLVSKRRFQCLKS